MSKIPYGALSNALDQAITLNRAVHKSMLDTRHIVDDPHYVRDCGTIVLACGMRVGKSTWAKQLLEQKPDSTLLISTYDMPDTPRALKVSRGVRSFSDVPYTAVAQDEKVMRRVLNTLRQLTQRSPNIDIVVIDCWLPEFAVWTVDVSVSNKVQTISMLEYAADSVQDAYGPHALLVVLG